MCLDNMQREINKKLGEEGGEEILVFGVGEMLGVLVRVCVGGRGRKGGERSLTSVSAWCSFTR